MTSAPAPAFPDLRPTKLKVVNLFGAPGIGKSGVRSGVFWLMKACHLSVEEVSEYAKYLVLTGRTWQLNEEQLYLFSKQLHKQNIVARNGYEYAVTDSPLQLSAFYAPGDYYKQFEPLVQEAYHRFDNINFFLTRNLEAEPFEERGRMHKREDSIRVEQEQRDFLAKKGITYIDLPVDMLTIWHIVQHLAPGLAPWPHFGSREED